MRPATRPWFSCPQVQFHGTFASHRGLFVVTDRAKTIRRNIIVLGVARENPLEEKHDRDQDAEQTDRMRTQLHANQRGSVVTWGLTIRIKVRTNRCRLRCFFWGMPRDETPRFATVQVRQYHEALESLDRLGRAIHDSVSSLVVNKSRLRRGQIRLPTGVARTCAGGIVFLPAVESRLAVVVPLPFHGRGHIPARSCCGLPAARRFGASTLWTARCK